MRVRRTLILLSVLLIGYIIATIGLRAIRDMRTPMWKKRLGAPALIGPVADGKFSLQYQRDHDFLLGDLLYADKWTSGDVEQILRFIDIPPIPESAVTDTDDFDLHALEMWLGRDDALTVVSERMAVGGPIEEDQKQILIDRLVEGLYEEQSFLYFGFSVARVIRAGLADTTGPIRDRVLYIYQHPREFFGDDGISVAANIKRQLENRNIFVQD